MSFLCDCLVRIFRVQQMSRKIVLQIIKETSHFNWSLCYILKIQGQKANKWSSLLILNLFVFFFQNQSWSITWILIGLMTSAFKHQASEYVTGLTREMVTGSFLTACICFHQSLFRRCLTNNKGLIPRMILTLTLEVNMRSVELTTFYLLSRDHFGFSQ